MERHIMCIDLKSFFASCECVERNINPFTTPLVVANPKQGKGAITLAITPYLKSKGIKSRTRLYEIPPWVKYEIVPPRMSLYIKKSKEVVDIYLDFVSEEDLHIYSIDECFLDYTGSMELFGNPVKIAYKIKDDIYRVFGFTVNVGVGNNKLLAKMASDFEKPNKVHTLFSNEVEEKMFPLRVDDLFMIGKASSKKLHEMGITTIEELAKYDVDMLTRKFKSMGKMMHDYANGIDNSPVYYEREAAKSISSSTVLPYNYHDISMIHDVIHNLSCDIGKKLRYNKMYADTIGVWLKYNYFDKVSKQVKLDFSIATDEEIYDNACRIFDNLWNHDDGIRSVCVFISGFSTVRKKQLSIFDNFNNNEDMLDNDKLQGVIDEIRDKYGDKVIGYVSDKDNRR